MSDAPKSSKGAGLPAAARERFCSRLSQPGTSFWLRNLFLFLVGVEVFLPARNWAQVSAASQTNSENARLERKEVSFGKVPSLARLGELVTSPDMQHLAFPVARAGRQVAWRDGVEGSAKGTLKFSPNDKRLVYGAFRGSKRLIVVDENAGPEFDDIDRGSLSFSPDSQHVVYAGVRLGRILVVVDQRQIERYDLVRGFAFESSNRLRFIARRINDSFIDEMLRVEIAIPEQHSR